MTESLLHFGALAGAISGIISLIVSVYVLLTARSHNNTKRINTIEREVNALKIELEHLPSVAAVAQLERHMSKLSTDIMVLSERMVGVAARLERLDRWVERKDIA